MASSLTRATHAQAWAEAKCRKQSDDDDEKGAEEQR